MHNELCHILRKHQWGVAQQANPHDKPGSYKEQLLGGADAGIP